MDGQLPPPNLANIDAQRQSEGQRFMAGEFVGPRPRTPKSDIESPYGRRMARMQAEWDRQHEIARQEEAAARQILESDRAYQQAQRDQYMQETKFAADMKQKEAEDAMRARIETDRLNALNELGSIDPQSFDYAQKHAEIAYKFPLAMADEAFVRTYNTYSGVHDQYMSGQKAMAERMAATQKEQQEVPYKLAKAGVPRSDWSKFLDKNAPEGQKLFDINAVNQAVGESEYAEKQAKPTTDKVAAIRNYLTTKGKYEDLESKGTPDMLAKAAARSDYAGAKSAMFQYADDPEVKKYLPKVESEADFSKYDVGDVVVGPDGSLLNVPPR